MSPDPLLRFCAVKRQMSCHITLVAVSLAVFSTAVRMLDF